MGDFTGFTFGGIHSSDLGITRVSGGNRYTEELQPEIKDRTAEVPGLDGVYYFGSEYNSKSIDIDFAFDCLTEEQFRKLRQTFGTKSVQQLIFDERPYKYYMAKIVNPIELSYVCFDELNYTWEKIQTGYNEFVKGIGGKDYEYKSYTDTTQRIYKGEGKITFICYFPFAKSVYKVLPLNEEDSDWVLSSGILSANNYAQFDTYISASEETQENPAIPAHIKIYNPGDLSTGFRLYCPFNEEAPASTTYDITIVYTINGDITHSLQITGLKRKGNDEGFLINTDSGLVQGVKDFAYEWPGNVTYYTTGNLYNQYIVAGYFFKLEPNTTADNVVININSTITDGIQIFYDYLYF